MEADVELEDRLTTANALIAASQTKDDDGFLLLWERITPVQQPGVALLLAHLAGREA